jgi:hypothetical protein
VGDRDLFFQDFQVLAGGAARRRDFVERLGFERLRFERLALWATALERLTL